MLPTDKIRHYRHRPTLFTAAATGMGHFYRFSVGRHTSCHNTPQKRSPKTQTPRSHTLATPLLLQLSCIQKQIRSQSAGGRALADSPHWEKHSKEHRESTLSRPDHYKEFQHTVHTAKNRKHTQQYNDKNRPLTEIRTHYGM